VRKLKINIQNTVTTNHLCTNDNLLKKQDGNVHITQHWSPFA